MATDPGSPAGPIVLPIGHYLGAYHREPGAPLAYHRVRVGRTLVRLRSDEWRLWALCHGLPGEQATPTWSRSDVLAAADRAGISGAAPLLRKLVTSGVVGEVAPDTPGSIDFAKSYRGSPLLFGIGLTGGPATVGIGFQGQLAIEVDSFGYELWRFGHRAGSLWEFARSHGEALVQAGGGAEITPEVLLLHIFMQLPRLLACNALYLDTVGR